MLSTKELQVFRIIEHWKPERKVIAPELLADKNYKLFNYLYSLTKKTYSKLPIRKNGEDPFIHPINLVLNLKAAKVIDEVTLSIALIHDLIEEEVDLFIQQNKLDEKDYKAAEKVERYEQQFFDNFSKELISFCQESGVSIPKTEIVIETLRLLTRHKRHFYYTSIAEIFSCKNNEIKEKAIQIKLADRIHNVLTIEEFDETKRIYECFKNLFILNNTKKYLIDQYGDLKNFHENFSSTEKLFNKCCKATYDAFLTICNNCSSKNIEWAIPILQIAFKKFEFEVSGLREVTKLNQKEVHPIRLFQGVVRKYDCTLHKEIDKFNSLTKKEVDYCKKFFADYSYSKEQLKAIVDYKDAYSLKEVIASLLYIPNYFIHQFICSELSPEGRIRVK